MLLLLASISGWAKSDFPVSSINVAIVRAEAWSEGNSAREGAAEMVVLLEIARLRQQSGQGGLIAVGDRRGLFGVGAEEALCHAVLQGMPVVKLAGSGRVLPAPHGLFLDGGHLSEEQARQVLVRCLSTYGALPVAKAEAGATVSPVLRNLLQNFQREFTLAAGTRLASQ